MSFFDKTHKKKALKLPNEIDLKNKIFSFKDQLYLLSNKDFISRNCQKLQQIKENTSKTKLKFSKDKDNNTNLSFKIKTPIHSNKRMLLKNDLINYNSYKHGNIIKNNNKLFFSLSSRNEFNEIKKINKAKSLVNIRNLNIISKNKKNENKLMEINNNIHKIKNNKKITKHPLLEEFSKIKKIYLNISTKHKSLNFSINSSVNSSQSREIYKKINKEKNKNNLLVRNGLKKYFFNKYINNRLNKSNSREKRNRTPNLFNELYDKIIQKSKEKNRLFLRLKKYNKSKDFSFSYHRNKNNRNYKNLPSKDVNDLMTSGSIDEKSDENYLENNPEEIHFKAVKYHQEIKINNLT